MASGGIYVSNRSHVASGGTSNLNTGDRNQHPMEPGLLARGTAASSPSPQSSPRHLQKPDLNGASRDGQDSLEDYFQEINNFQEDDDGGDDHGSDDDQLKTPDEGEQEVVWLQEAGYGHLASKFVEGKEIEEDLIKDDTSSLTRAQAAAVRKRVDTLNATIHKKQKQRLQYKTDVRDVFSPAAESSVPVKSSSGVAMRHQDSGHSHRRGSARGSNFLKNRGTYSMIDSSSQDFNPAKGIETLSINTRDQTGDRSPSIRHKSDSQVPQGHSDDSDVSPVQVNDSSGKETPGVNKASRTKPIRLSSDGLPNFVLQKDSLGVTRVGNLGKSDVVKLHSLALIELTSLLDIHNISYTRRKSKRKLKEHGVYGVPLQTLYDHDCKRKPNIKVPLIFSELIQFLNKHGVPEEGILRVPGAVSRIMSLRQEIEEKFPSGRFSWEDMRPHDAAGLLKQFLRDLPIPLLTFQYIDAFAAVQKIPDFGQQLQALNLLVLLLPDVHRNTLQMLLQFLKRVVDCKENKMTMNNVAMIMAPNLFLVGSSRGSKSAPAMREYEISMATSSANIVKMMIKFQDILTSVPSFMISQIRHQYETEQLRSSGNKSIMKFLGRKDKSEGPKKPQVQHEGDFQAGVIRVQAPHLNMCTTAVQLDQSTTASDIVARFCNSSIVDVDIGRRDSCEDELDGRVNPCLYEQGGNIGERKLEGDTNMLALYRVNPNADWVIRTKPD